MFRFISSGPERGDCTAPYNIALDKIYTVEEFIQTILTRIKEWGHIGIDDGKTIFGNPSCEYRYGKLLSTLPENIRKKQIISVRADGGWTAMDYYIKI